jgi:hypothetical protein
MAQGRHPVRRANKPQILAQDKARLRLSSGPAVRAMLAFMLPSSAS